MSRRRIRSRSASTPAIGSSGPTISAVPCTPIHSQPARKTRAAVGFWRRLASFAVPPWDTSATVGSPETGCGTTPAFTTEVDGSPLGWMVTTTARKYSRAPSSLIRVRPCSADSMLQTLLVNFGMLALVSAVAVLGPLLAVPQRWHLPVVLGELL